MLVAAQQRRVLKHWKVKWFLAGNPKLLATPFLVLYLFYSLFVTDLLQNSLPIFNMELH